eukprot:7841750-Prorocentrum_lima.AAC.1
MGFTVTSAFFVDSGENAAAVDLQQLGLESFVGEGKDTYFVTTLNVRTAIGQSAQEWRAAIESEYV